MLSSLGSALLFQLTEVPRSQFFGESHSSLSLRATLTVLSTRLRWLGGL